MKIRVRLILGIGLLAGLFVVMAGLSIVSTIEILNWEADIYEIRLVSIDKLIEADRDAYQSHLNLAYLLWGSSIDSLSSTEQQSFIDGIEENAVQVKERFDLFRNTLTKTSVPDDIQTNLDQFDSQYSTWLRITEQILSQQDSGSIEESVGTFEKSYNPAFDELRNNLDVLTEFSLAEAEQNHTNVENTGNIVLSLNLGVTLLGFITAGIVIIMLIRKVLKPIATVNHNVFELSTGTGDLTQRLPVTGNDEMAELSSNINNFIRKIEEIMIGLLNSTQKSEQIQKGLVATIEENATGATEISANVGSITKQIANQNTNIQQIKQSLDSVQKSIDVFENQVSDQASMVEESTASVTEMIASIQNLAQITQSRRQATEQLRKTVEEGNKKVAESNSTVQLIHNDVDSILEMTKLISGIASQTNLLSMNAAIEAAHAGDAGKGFSVVAAEIRKLAETSSTQSSSIGEVLARVVANIEKASSASNYTSDIYMDILKEFSVLTDAFDEIAQNSLELDTGGKQILEAMNQLSDHSQTVKTEAFTIRDENETISKEMKSIADGSFSVSSASTEISSGMKEISDSLVHLRELSTNLADSMVEAIDKLNLFKLSQKM